MAEDQPAPKANLRAILLTGLVSLVVGVGSGWMINILTEKRARLTYDVTTQEVFTGEVNNIGIVAVRISNDGKREIEDLLCHLRFAEGEITERRLTGLPEAARTLGGTPKEVHANVPFLNPGESFSIQVLLREVAEPLGSPAIDVRGRGVVATKADTSESADLVRDVFPLLGASFASVAAALAVLASRSRRRRLHQAIYITSKGAEEVTHHSADQRDAVAYVLDITELFDEAQELRAASRKQTYWAISDSLCAKWLRTGNEETINKGILALSSLLSYAAIAEESRRIVALNIARLALASKNLEVATEYLAKARDHADPVIGKRIAADPVLNEFAHAAGV